MTPSRVRFALQCCFALFCLHIGFELWQHVQWATGQTDHFTPKPGAVEGFLPIAALMAAKRLLITAQWDPVHPAGLTIFIAIVGMSLLFRKGFCGHISPRRNVSDAPNVLRHVRNRIAFKQPWQAKRSPSGPSARGVWSHCWLAGHGRNLQAIGPQKFPRP